MTPDDRAALLERAEEERDAYKDCYDAAVRQRDDARFVADRKHGLIEKLYASLHELQEELSQARTDNAALAAQILRLREAIHAVLPPPEAPA